MALDPIKSTTAFAEEAELFKKLRELHGKRVLAAMSEEDRDALLGGIEEMYTKDTDAILKQRQ